MDVVGDLLFGSSSSDDENGNERQVKIYKLRRTADENNYRKLYRFTPENVQYLVEKFMPEYYETRGGALSNTEKMRTFLRYVGDPGFQVGVGEDLGINQSTVSYTIWNVCKHIVDKAGEWICFPSTDQQFEEAKQIWRNNFKFPCAIGALDGTLVKIDKPRLHGDEYVCRKGYAAFNVQATCDGNGIFTSVDCSWAGSVHDARIWRNSNIQKTLNANTCGALLLADEGYPLTPWLMTIFRNPTTEREQSYNELHKKERSLIERSFGQLKKRFPILHSQIRVATERVPSIVLACFILNNVAKHLKDPDYGEDLDDTEEEAENDHTIDNTLRRRGVARRNQIATTIAGL